jgi:hypothetical protein
MIHSELVGQAIRCISLMGLVRLNLEDPPRFHDPKNPELRLNIERAFTIRTEHKPSGAKVNFVSRHEHGTT